MRLISELTLSGEMGLIDLNAKRRINIDYGLSATCGDLA